MRVEQFRLNMFFGHAGYTPSFSVSTGAGSSMLKQGIFNGVKYPRNNETHLLQWSTDSESETRLQSQQFKCIKIYTDVKRKGHKI